MTETELRERCIRASCRDPKMNDTSLSAHERRVDLVLAEIAAAGFVIVDAKALYSAIGAVANAHNGQDIATIDRAWRVIDRMLGRSSGDLDPLPGGTDGE